MNPSISERRGTNMEKVFYRFLGTGPACVLPSVSSLWLAFALSLHLLSGRVASGQQPCLRWSQVISAGSPGPRFGHAMAYDSDRGVTVLFGGAPDPLENPSDNETWEYDGQAWKRVPITGTKPSPRAFHAMAYDQARRQVVLFGGKPSNRETWVYTSDGITGTWTRRFPDDAPGRNPEGRCDGGLFGHCMIYDVARRVVMLYGGAERCDFLSPRNPPYDTTWQWNDSNWTVAGGRAGYRIGAAMAFDSALQVALLFGGEGCDQQYECTDPTPRTGTWLYQNGTWTEAPGATPALRSGHAMAYDDRRHKVVMFGGGSTPGIGDDTDEYTSGVGWNSLLDTGPPPRAYHAMIYDRRRGVMVLYGGLTPAIDGVYADTWELDVCTRPPDPVRWVDFAYTGSESGSFTAPFNTLIEGTNNVPTGGMLKIKAGASSERLIISKPMTISAYGGRVIIGQ